MYLADFIFMTDKDTIAKAEGDLKLTPAAWFTYQEFKIAVIYKSKLPLKLPRKLTQSYLCISI